MKQCSVAQTFLDKIYSNKFIEHEWSEILDLEYEPNINEYIILKGLNKASAIVRYTDESCFELVDGSITLGSIRPKDAEQLALLDALLNPDIQIITITGPAGSGKTFLSLAYALEEVLGNKELTLVLTKSTETVKQSKFFGAVPGTVDEKFAPFLESFDLAIRKLAGGRAYSDLMKDKDRLVYKPIEFCRGDSRENSILIADEMQNCTWHELKTLLSRFGENSKCIVLGDLNQKDVRRGEDSGLEAMIKAEAYRGSPLTTNIHLMNDYRGPISHLIQIIDDEIK